MRQTKKLATFSEGKCFCERHGLPDGIIGARFERVLSDGKISGLLEWHSEQRCGTELHDTCLPPPCACGCFMLKDKASTGGLDGAHAYEECRRPPVDLAGAA